MGFCCTSRAQRANMTMVEKTQASLRCVLNTLAVFVALNVVALTLSGAFVGAVVQALFWGVMLGFGFRAAKNKNERQLRQYIAVVMCALCCGMVLMFISIAAAGHHGEHGVQYADDQNEETKPMLNVHDPQTLMPVKNVDQPMMTMHDPKTLKPLAEAPKAMLNIHDPKTLMPVKEQPKPVDVKPVDQPTDGNDDGDDDEGERRHVPVAFVFFGMLYMMTFLALKVASIMLAARLVRLCKLERLSAHSMMTPTKEGDIALQPMPTTGSPQVFYMPTADGQPQYVVYQPVQDV